MLPENIINGISSAQNKFNDDRAEEKLLIKNWQAKQKQLEELNIKELQLKKVQILFQKAAEQTQKQLEFHINGLVSTALAAIWNDPYEFKLEFVQRRGKTEADLWLVDEEGHKIKPLDESGGGVADVVSIALRVAFWSLEKESRPLLIIDEPVRHTDNDLPDRIFDMLKMLSENVRLQILMITHIKELTDKADKKFVVSKKDGKSIVKVEE